MPGVRGTGPISLESATLLVASLLYAARGGAAELQSILTTPGPVAADVKERELKALVTAIHDAAKLVSRQAISDEWMKKSSAKDMALITFVGIKAQLCPENNSKAAADRVMCLVWDKVWDKKIVKEHRKQLLKGNDKNNDMPLPNGLYPAEARWRKKMRLAAPRAWRDFRDANARLERVERQIVRNVLKKLELEKKTR